MSLFKKKTVEVDTKDTLDEKENGSERKKVFKKKDFKDLGSENKRARREPKKPWGKYERYLVLTVLLFTVGISVYLWLKSTSFLKDLKIGSIRAPSIFNEETIVIEKDN